MKSGYFRPDEPEQRGELGELDAHEVRDVDVDEPTEGVGPLGTYFQQLEREAHACFDVAHQARKRGFDPESEPEIPFAEDLASRVEALVGPEGVADRIRELSETLGREELALTISKEVAAGNFCTYDGSEEALDGSIRTGLAILTEGILVAPLEGVAHVRVRPNDQGEDYADVYFAGPIRAAGGTGQALSVLIADVVRRELGLGKWNASTAEAERFKEEIPAYKKAANLQYTPGPDEIDLIVRNLPVGVNGEGTEQEEVSGYRDMARVETNQLRGGACLVLAEGLTLKAPKILKHVEKLGLEGWEFLDEYIQLTKGEDEDAGDGTKKKGPKIKPIDKFVKELTAGRPVLSHPMATGGFRLRYGRARTAGLASTAVHPALTVLTDDFLAVGTQLKVERPGKGTIVTPCDTIEPPIVRLDTGDVIEVDTVAQAETLRGRVAKILDLGEMLVPFGEFLENNKPLPAASWCPEWWALVVEDAGRQPPGVSEQEPAGAFAFAKRTDTPLHPRFTLFWHDVEPGAFDTLAVAVEQADWTNDRLVLAPDADVKELLEALGATHKIVDTEQGERLRVSARCSLPVVRGVGFEVKGGRLERVRERPADLEDPVQIASQLSGVQLKAKAPCRIGARMGRPEKAAERKMSPPVHALFPLGGAGGMQRLIKQAAAQGEIGVDASQGRSFDAIETGTRACPSCQHESLHLDCPECGERTLASKGRPRGGKIPLRELVEEALERLSEGKMDPNTKGVRGLISETKLPEPIEKGVLRAKHGISVFKDGTCRFDMTDLSLTQFKPQEIGTSVEQLRSMGYLVDIDGEELTDPGQTLELKPQDIVINDDALTYMSSVAQFVDDLLARFYGLEPFYNLQDERDLVGHLAVGLAPHTSGGVLCRIIGTTRAQGHWGHPFFHAAKRRNCFTGDTEVLVYQHGEPSKVRLDELVDPHLDADAHPLDTEGTEVADAPSDLEVLSLDPETGEPVRRQVTKLIRGRTQRWIELDTSAHRSIKVTPDHRVLVRRDGELIHLAAEEVEPGDEVPVGLSLPREPRAPTFNLAELLAELPEAETIRVRGAETWLRERVQKIGPERVARSCAQGPSIPDTPSRWFCSFPLPHLKALVDDGLLSYDELPETARVGIARDHADLPLRLQADEDLCRLLGLYLAGGHARSTASAHQISWRASEPELAGKIQDLIERVFEREPSVSEEGTKITLCSKIAYLLLTRAWQAGEGAKDKRVPGWCYELPDQHITELLGGFFDGDGSVVHDPARIRFYSSNMRLLEDLSTLLQAVGLFARFVPGSPREPGRFLKDRYEALGREPPETLAPVHALNLTGQDVKLFASLVHTDHPAKRDRLQALSVSDLQGRLIKGVGPRRAALEHAHHLFDEIVSVEQEDGVEEGSYCLDIETGSEDLRTKNVLLGNGLYQIRCDGDEDCVMLLLDGLLNFSRTYLPDRRGGQMDAPLTLSIRVDPTEIDKEAHNIECVRSYPLAFFEATEANPGPKEVEDLVEIVSDRLGTEDQYTHMHFTHDTGQIDEGPLMSAYKTIDTMLEKMEGQLELATRIRAVDEGDVASRVICDHFLPDIIGNLKAFSRQVVRCAKCNAKYRRVPLTGRCRKCKNTLTMTVHEASVKKYIEVSKQVSQKYPVDAYTHQRLRLAEEAIESLFQNDKVKKAKLTDFM